MATCYGIICVRESDTSRFPKQRQEFFLETPTGVLRLPALPGGQRDVGFSWGTLTGALGPMTLPAGQLDSDVIC